MIESCEGLIESQKSEFKHLLEYLLAQVELCKIVLTSTMRLKDSNEELIVVEGLTPQHTIALFRRAAQRVITIKEEEELLGRKDCQHRIKVHDHDLFKKIGGNP